MKALLIRLRDYIVESNKEPYGWNCLGLCYAVDVACLSKVFTEEERDRIRDYILENRPRKGKHYDPLYKNHDYY